MLCLRRLLMARVHEAIVALPPLRTNRPIVRLPPSVTHRTVPVGRLTFLTLTWMTVKPPQVGELGLIAERLTGGDTVRPGGGVPPTSAHVNGGAVSPPRRRW